MQHTNYELSWQSIMNANVSIYSCLPKSLILFLILSIHFRNDNKSENADSLNKTFLWSDTSTSDYLTTYAEGLICSRYQHVENYYVRRVKKNKWWVLNKNYKHSTIFTSSDEITRFVRVREVCMEESYAINVLFMWLGAQVYATMQTCCSRPSVDDMWDRHSKRASAMVETVWVVQNNKRFVAVQSFLRKCSNIIINIFKGIFEKGFGLFDHDCSDREATVPGLEISE